MRCGFPSRDGPGGGHLRSKSKNSAPVALTRSIASASSIAAPSPAPKHVAEDFSVAVAVLSEALSGLDDVIVDHAK